MLRKLLCYALFLFFTPAIFSQSLTKEWEMLTDSGINENYEIRQKHRAVIQSKSYEAIRAPKRIFSQSESKVNVRFETRKSADAFYLLFVNQYQDRFPLWSSGTYIIKKDLETGDYIQAKIFLYNNEDSYIRIYPEQDRTRLDLTIFGQEIYTGVRVAISFDKLVILPIGKILELTENKIQWKNLLTDISYSEWRDVEKFSTWVQDQVDFLGDADDGAINAKGEYVYIETLEPQINEAGLNCSGFTKWTVDQLYKGLTGKLLEIEPLKKKHYDLRGNSWTERAEDRDPFFGLDWTRNLGYFYRSALYPEQPIDFLSCDINSVPYFTYQDNVGYEIEQIAAALFLEAINSPGRIYLGSANKPFGVTNTLRQHVHIVVLFPYFTTDGQFKIDVVERQTITGIESLKRRYHGEFMHLVQIELK